MLDSIEDYEWKETDTAKWEKTYRNMDNDLLYVEDTYTNGTDHTQTEISDWHNDRYAVKHRPNYTAPATEDKTLHTSMSWNEAEAFLEAKAGDFQ